jgi:hypothetical protein
MSDDRLILPGFGRESTQPVTRSEFDGLKKKVVQLNGSVQSISLRNDALIRGLSGGNLLPGVSLNLTAYYRYVDRVGQSFIPFLITILNSATTIADKCQRALSWNAGNPDLLIYLDDLMLLVDDGSQRLATPEDLAALKLLPGTEVFWETWAEMSELP